MKIETKTKVEVECIISFAVENGVKILFLPADDDGKTSCVGHDEAWVYADSTLSQIYKEIFDRCIDAGKNPNESEFQDLEEFYDKECECFRS